MLEQYGVPASRVKLMVDRFSGAFSGGTVASMINIMEQAGKDREVRRVVADPYALLPQGAVAARLAGLAMTAGTASLAISPLRAIARRFLPVPGEGPSKEQREKGFFDIYLYGVHPTDRGADLVARVTGDRDPGYGSTSKMLAEAAVCLSRDDLDCEGGFWTPASAMGRVLIERLQESAGLTFELVPDVP